jgi:hypothetical protein
MNGEVVWGRSFFWEAIGQEVSDGRWSLKKLRRKMAPVN